MTSHFYSTPRSSIEKLLFFVVRLKLSLFFNFENSTKNLPWSENNNIWTLLDPFILWWDCVYDERCKYDGSLQENERRSWKNKIICLVMFWCFTRLLNCQCLYGIWFGLCTVWMLNGLRKVDCDGEKCRFAVIKTRIKRTIPTDSTTSRMILIGDRWLSFCSTFGDTENQHEKSIHARNIELRDWHFISRRYSSIVNMFFSF